jgi:hypothetical protein
LSGPQSDNSSGFVGGQSSFPGNGGGVLFEAVVPPAGIVPLDCFVCLCVCVCVCVCVFERKRRERYNTHKTKWKQIVR